MPEMQYGGAGPVDEYEKKEGATDAKEGFSSIHSVKSRLNTAGRQERYATSNHPSKNTASISLSLAAPSLNRRFKG